MGVYLIDYQIVYALLPIALLATSFVAYREGNIPRHD